MKAWVVRKTGVPSTSPHFQLELDYPRPVPTGELVLVRVHAVGINSTRLLRLTAEGVRAYFLPVGSGCEGFEFADLQPIAHSASRANPMFAFPIKFQIGRAHV